MFAILLSPWRSSDRAGTKPGSQFTNRQSRHWLVLILFLSLVAPLVYSFYQRIPPVVDARAYDNIARNLVAHYGFRESLEGDILFDRAIQRAGPGYEYFLAGLYAIFAPRYEAVWAAQAILHALTAWLIYLCALRIFDRKEKIGLVAAALFGLHPDLIEIAAMLMTETWYLFWTVLAVYLFIRVWQAESTLPSAARTAKAGSERWIYSALLAITLGIGILSRPPLLLFVPVAWFFYLTRKRYAELAVSLCLIGLVLTPWTLRNYRIYHQFIPTTLIGEYNLWVGNTLAADGGQLAGGYNPFDEYVAVHGYGTVKPAAREAFFGFLRDHPARFLSLTGLRFVKFFSLIRPMGFWFYQSGGPQLVFVAASGLAIFALFVLGFTGLCLLWKERKPIYYYLITLTLTAPLVLLPTVVQSRYRFQIYPFLALLAGYALFKLYSCGRTWCKQRALVYTFAFLLGVSILDALTSWEDLVSHLRIFD